MASSAPWSPPASPVDECLGTDDCKNLKDRRKPALKQDEEPAIIVLKPDAAMKPAPQNNQLMPKRRVLNLKPHLRLEWRGQDGQDETQKPDHFASIGDSVTPSTRIRFSVQTSMRAPSPAQQPCRHRPQLKPFLDTEALKRLGAARRPRFAARAASLFGNGCQAIEIARACFGRFFQMRLEIVE